MSTQNKLFQEVQKHLKLLANTDQNTGKLLKNAKVVDVKEFKFTDDKKNESALVVYLPFPFHKEHKSQIKLICNHLTDKRKQHAFVVAKRTIIHERSDYPQKIPRNRTLTSVYDSILEDILLPAQIIGKRIRIRSDGSQLIKVHVNEDSREFIESKVDLICHLYKALTNRNLAIEFRQEANYIQLPQVRRKIKKTKKRQPKTAKN